MSERPTQYTRADAARVKHLSIALLEFLRDNDVPEPIGCAALLMAGASVAAHPNTPDSAVEDVVSNFRTILLEIRKDMRKENQDERARKEV